MAEMALGYGSEFQMLRYLGHHRNFLNKEICKTIGDGDIEWLDFPVDLKRVSCDGELKGIECFLQLEDFPHISNEWKKFWPQSGNSHNWDGIFTQNGTWYFVEAKAHLEEANQTCGATSKASIDKIIEAFTATCGNRSMAEEWMKSNCYQLANRLAFIHFCELVGIKAKVVYICFVNGFESRMSINVNKAEKWQEKMNEEYNSLGLSAELKSKIFNVIIDCHQS